MRAVIRFAVLIAFLLSPRLVLAADLQKGLDAYDVGDYETAYAECLPRYDNFVELDPHVRDAWGIPALRIQASWSDNEMGLYRHMLDSAEEMLDAAGATDIVRQQTPRWPGGATHEVGTARMGNDPKKSVLNKWRQAHDVRNVFVTDGAAFVSVACQNPTLTMMALTLQPAEYIIDQAKRGELG